MCSVLGPTYLTFSLLVASGIEMVMDLEFLNSRLDYLIKGDLSTVLV